MIPTSRRLGMLLAAWRLRRRLLARRPTLVHADGIKAALVTVIATAATDIPVVWFKVDYSRDGRLARAIASRCRQVIGISASVTETFARSLRDRVRVVPCGIPDYTVDRAAGRQMVRELVGDHGDQAPVVAHLGRLHQRKGQLELVEVAPAVLRRHPNVRFLLFPPPPEGDREREYEARLRKRIDELGISDAVRLLPGTGRAVDVMAGCDLVVVSSIPDEVSGWREGFGLVGVEAMAAGTPVAGYADGALPEVLGDCAALVPTGDRRALGEAIIELLDDPTLRESLVHRGRRRAERYRLRSTVESLKGCYREAVGAG